MIKYIFEEECLMKNCYIGLGPIESGSFENLCKRLFLFSGSHLKGLKDGFNYAAVGWNKYACYIHFQLDKEVKANKVLSYLGITGDSDYNIISIYDPTDDLTEGSLHVIKMDSYYIAGICK